MSNRNALAALLVALIWITYESLCFGAGVVFVLDRSGSMKGEKMRAAKEGAKLGVALLDGEVAVTSFANDAQQHGERIQLQTAEARLRAMKSIDAVDPNGGTNYMSALQLMSTYPRDTVFVFVSDGENEQGTPDDVCHLAQNLGPIHTVGAQTNRQSQSLLSRMATVSNGSFTQVESPQALTEALISIAQRITQYRTYQPKSSDLKFEDCEGSLIAIGYSAFPQTTGAGASLFHHRAKLAEHVVLDRYFLGERSDVQITIGAELSDRARLARVLMNGLPVESLVIPNDPTFAVGQTIDATVVFNKPVDRRVRVEFSVIDAATRRVLSTVTGNSLDARTIGSTVQVPSEPGIYAIHSMSHLDVSGHDTTREQQRSITVVRPRYYGLADLKPVDLGSVHAGKRTVLGKLEIDTPDKSPVEYSVSSATAWRMGDTSAQVAVTTDPTTILPQAGRPARISLSANLSSAVPGRYSGKLLITSETAFPQRKWEQEFTFQVNEPISVTAVDLGDLEVGGTAQGVLEIRNDSEVKQKVHISMAPWTTSGGSIVATLEKDQLEILPGASTKVRISVIGNPNITTRGELTSRITCQAGVQRAVHANLRINLVDRSEVFLVGPDQPRWNIVPGEPRHFQLEVRAAARARLADTFTAEWIPGDSLDSVVVAFEHKRPLVLREGEVVTLSGYFVSRRPASGEGVIELRSKRNGTQQIRVHVSSQ